LKTYRERIGKSFRMDNIKNKPIIDPVFSKGVFNRNDGKVDDRIIADPFEPSSAEENSGIKNDLLKKFWKDSAKVLSISEIKSEKNNIEIPPKPEFKSKTPDGNFDVTVTGFPQYTGLFQNRKGWTGGDGDYSIPLSQGRTLWLYGDSFLGEVKENKRLEDYKLLNNTISIQEGINPTDAKVSFFSGKTESGESAAFVTPSDEKGWLWPYSGIRTDKGLFLFLIQIKRDETEQLGFKTTSTSIARISNPDDPPDRWKVSQEKIPFGKLGQGNDLFFGSTVMKHGEDLYVYGIREKKENGVIDKQMIVARVTGADPEDFSKWQFYGDGKWHSDYEKAEGLCGNFANEFSVSYNRELNKFVTIYTENGCSGNIGMRTADKPEGPWSKPSTIYQCPEVGWHKNILIYAAKGHQELSEKPNELVTSYVTNSLDFKDLIEDQRHYWPQFLKIKFEPARKDPGLGEDGYIMTRSGK
jgi:hypothetical protein